MGDGVRFLIADDNELFRRSAVRILEKLGYHVVGEADNGRVAVELAEELRPDLILMDFEMPGLNGIEAARQIQQICPTPVILLTAHQSEELLVGARDAGVTAYLLKPLDAHEIRRMATIALARFEDWKELKRINTELAARNEQLRTALGAIKTLKGLLPVCAWCGRKIRTDDGEWVPLESYIESQTDAQFTHGICPQCLAKFQQDQRK